MIIQLQNEPTVQRQVSTLEAKGEMAERGADDPVIITDHGTAVVVVTDHDQDHEVVIIAIDLLRHTEDDHHLHTNAKGDLALKPKSDINPDFKNNKLGATFFPYLCK